ncbi:MAG: TetR/AcrR family transcriptional regulator [Bacteroidales bacterium]
MAESMENSRYIQIVNTGKALFWKHGLKRVTVEEICREAGVSKMTFYKFFPNKVVLAKTIYDRVVDEAYARFKAVMYDENITPVEKMQQILIIKMEGSNDVSQEFMKDFYTNPELGLSEFVEEKSRNIWVEVIKDFKMAQERGWLRNDFKPEGIFLIMSKFKDFFNDEGLVQMYDTPQELVMEIARLFTLGILGREHGKNQR